MANVTDAAERNDGGTILDWSKMDDEQRAAGRTAHKLFVEMANRVDKSSSPPNELSFLPRLDPNRRNHTVLIDGTRGSGKTAVMLRLLQDWSDKLIEPGESRPPLYAPAPGNGDPCVALKDGAVLVPVGLLDLEAVPPTANLATRLAGMFKRVVSAMEQRGTTTAAAHSAPSWASLEDDVLKSRQKWQRFVNAASLEWDRSLERRRSAVDPEAYAVEVEQAETKGLRARDTFRDFIDALVEDWANWPPRRGTRPFFIVPIDDADLNPARVVELFGLLRTLWHPRVGYLLTGDSGLFEHVLTTHFRSQIDMPQLGGQTTLDNFRVQLVLDSDRAERLARDYYHKAVSLENCRKLRPVPGDVRLGFVRDALSRPNLTSLLRILGTTAQNALVLPGRWRKLKDLLDSITNGDFDGEFGSERLAQKMWEDVLDDSSLLRSEAEELHKYAQFRGKQQRLTLVPAQGPGVTIDTRKVQGRKSGLATVSVYRGHRFLATRTRDESIAAGWLVLRQLTREETEQIPEYMLVGSEFSVSEVAQGATSVAPGGSQAPMNPVPASPTAPTRLPLSWPLPKFRQLGQLQIFLAEWDKHNPGADDLGTLARTFLSVALCAMEKNDGGLLDWKALAKEIVVGAGSVPTEETWYHRAALLAAPEYGLDPEAADAWLDALKSQLNVKSGSFWQRVFELRKEAIVRALKSAKEQGGAELAANAVIANIDNGAPRDAWRSVVAAEPSR